MTGFPSLSDKDAADIVQDMNVNESIASDSDLVRALLKLDKEDVV